MVVNKIDRDEKGRFVKGRIFYHSEDTKSKIKPTQFKKGHKINLGRKPFNSSKSYEEVYGKEKALDIKNKIGLKSLGRVPANKGLTYEEFFGEDVANDLKQIVKANRANQVVPMNDTKIEVKIQNYLKELKIEFFTHYYCREIIHSYQCDFFIPVQKSNIFFIKEPIILEADGDYWHGNKKIYPNSSIWQKEQIEEDKIRTEELKNKGFRVIRLWENEIKKLNLNDFKEVIFK